MPVVTWVVGPLDGDSVGAIVEKMVGLDGVDQRRIHLNGRAAAPSDTVGEGDRVSVRPMPTTRAGLPIIAHRDGLVIVDKMSGVPTEPTPGDARALTDLLSESLGGARVHAQTRLDVPVSGLVLCTLGRDAARRVERTREKGTLHRTYLALSAGELKQSKGEWIWPLGKTKDRAGRHRSRAGGPGARKAVTAYEVIATRLDPRGRPVHLMRLKPKTGRMHQLRVHASAAGVPLLGDRLYGGDTSLAVDGGSVVSVPRVCLHAARLGIDAVHATSTVPSEVTDVWVALGGETTDFQP